MDIRNYEFNQVSGLPVVGATVTVYTATLTHPPVTTVTSGVTNGDGLWSFTGLTDTPKDVKVVANGQTKWYKGMSRHGASTIFFEEPLRFQQVASIASAPGAGASVLGFLTDGEPIFRSGAAGAQTKIATYTGATGVLRSTGWGTIQTADIADSQVTSAKIADSTIVNADLATAAAVVVSKLAAGGTANRVVATSDGTTMAMQQIATGMLATNAVTQFGIATGVTSGPTTASGTYATLTDMSITLTVTGGPVLVLYSGSITNSGAGNATQVAFKDNGGAANGDVIFQTAVAGALGYLPVVAAYIFAAPAAGSRTFTTVWATNSGTSTAYLTARTMIAIELKK